MSLTVRLPACTLLPYLTCAPPLGHAYALMQAEEVEGRKFLRLRNPWGKFEWKGAWADGSPQWNKHPKVCVCIRMRCRGTRSMYQGQRLAPQGECDCVVPKTTRRALVFAS